MGASGWDYIVPYDADLNKALQKLRQSEFQAGRYYRLGGDASKPESINALQELNMEAGTHSILDMERISSQAEFGAVSPLADAEQIELFGTTQPTADLVRANLFKIMEFRRRWHGTYVIIYENGSPHEILFTGFSGD